MKQARGLIIISILVICGMIACTIYYKNIINYRFWNNDKPTIIETATIVKEVKNIAELYSVCYYDQLVADSVVKESNLTGKVLSLFGTDNILSKKVVLIASAQIYAGFDLKSLDSNNISVKDSILFLRMEEPKILDILMNPSDISVFSEKGEWSFNEIQNLKTSIVKSFRKRAIERGILVEAKKRGKDSISGFFKSLGFKDVVIEFTN